MLHKINFPATCLPYFEWIVALQRRLLTALCQDSIESPNAIDEIWLINALGDFAVDQGWLGLSQSRRICHCEQREAISPLSLGIASSQKTLLAMTPNDFEKAPDWFGRFCNWKHKDQTLLEHARSIADFSTEIKTRLLANFENDHTFESLFDPQAQDAHDLVGLSPLQALDPQVAEVVRRFFESFYDPALYRGYKILIEGELAGFDRKKFVQRFEDANPDVCVCPMCDGYLGNAQVDHFFPKAAYPYLSCHPLNLIPICGDCNGPGGKYKTPPLSLDSSSHQTDDWFHPYLRSAHGTYTVSFERQREGPTPVLISEDKQAQARLDNMSALLKLGERWRRALSLKTRIAQKRIWRVHKDLGRSLTEAELCDRLAEWAKSAEDEIGLESFAIIKAAYFQQASRKEPILFDELWIYNIPDADAVTASCR